eukprot:NODE_1431_length_1164_cov_209.568610_g1050_i1.p1 GENE.NODE_1431_length_1164_cov_209.568610_g1050_i1~~NODE_1431_length_1164_cov_209.568610_g1050_i1.p1  ORF type:complete len:308 (+),score=109.80 NODE_1431_length_1164_cov_209.568610_g1050_i1:141-1064(+)
MERYAPSKIDLASRDVVSRSMAIEIREGRGCGPKKDHVYLELHHLPREELEKKLAGIMETARTFAGVDLTKEPIPVCPTVHYNMGGIPTLWTGEVVYPRDGDDNTIVPGLLAAGEAACASVHGANRLGANSLLDIIVFGRSCANTVIFNLNKEGTSQPELPARAGEESVATMDRIMHNNGDIPMAALRAKMKDSMQANASVFRDHEDFKHVQVHDKSRIWNQNLTETLEFRNLLVNSLLTVKSALERKESRGAHSREDFKERDDINWMKHTMAWFNESGEVDLTYREVHSWTLTNDVKPIPPQDRVY